MVFGQEFNGSRDTAMPAWTSIRCYWCWQLPLGYFLAKPVDIGAAILRMGGLTRVGWNLRAFVCAVGTRCGVIGRLLSRYPGGRVVWQRQ